MLIDASREQIGVYPAIEPRALFIRGKETQDVEAILYDFAAEFGKDQIPPAFKSGYGPGIREWCVHRGVLVGNGPSWQLTLFSGYRDAETIYLRGPRHEVNIWVTHDAYDGWFVTLGQAPGAHENFSALEFTIPCPDLDFYAVYRTPGQTDEIVAATRPTAWEHIQREDS